MATQRNLRFNVNSKSNSTKGSIILTFDDDIIHQIEEEVDDFIEFLSQKQNISGVSVKKASNGGYDINPTAVHAISNKIFDVLKKNS